MLEEVRASEHRQVKQGVCKDRALKDRSNESGESMSATRGHMGAELLSERQGKKSRTRLNVLHAWQAGQFGSASKDQLVWELARCDV